MQDIFLGWGDPGPAESRAHQASKKPLSDNKDLHACKSAYLVDRRPAGDFSVPAGPPSPLLLPDAFLGDLSPTLLSSANFVVVPQDDNSFTSIKTESLSSDLPSKKTLFLSTSNKVGDSGILQRALGLHSLLCTFQLHISRSLSHFYSLSLVLILLYNPTFLWPLLFLVDLLSVLFAIGRFLLYLFVS